MDGAGQLIATVQPQPASQGFVQNPTGRTLTGQDSAAANGLAFLGLIEQHFGALSEDTLSQLTALSSDADGLSGFAQPLPQGLLHDLSQLETDDLSLSDLDLADDLSPEDIAWLQQLDLPALAQQLQSLKGADAAVTLDDGTAISVEELLDLLTEVTPAANPAAGTKLNNAGLDDPGQRAADGADSLLSGINNGDNDDAGDGSNDSDTLNTVTAPSAIAGIYQTTPVQGSSQDRNSLSVDAVTAKLPKALESNSKTTHAVEAATRDAVQQHQLLDAEHAARHEAREARIASVNTGADRDGFKSSLFTAADKGAGATSQTGSQSAQTPSASQLAALGLSGETSEKSTSGQHGGQGHGGLGHGGFGTGDGLTQPATGVQPNGATLNNASFQATLNAAHNPRAQLSPASMQVSVQLQSAVAQGQSQLKIQLHPAELGAIDVELSFDDDGKVHGKLIAEKPETLDMLRNDSRTLEKSLQDAGLQLDSGGLQFSLKGGDQPQDDSRNAGLSGGKDSSDAVAAVAGDDADIIEHSLNIITEDRVDIRI